MAKTSKNGRKNYRFSIEDTPKNNEIILFLESIPKPLRGYCIIEALKVLKERLDIHDKGKKTSVSNPVFKLDKVL